MDAGAGRYRTERPVVSIWPIRKTYARRSEPGGPGGSDALASLMQDRSEPGRIGARFEGRLVRETPNRVVTALRYSWFAVSIALVLLYALWDRLPAAILMAVSLAWFPLTFAMIPILRHFAKKSERRLAEVRIDDEGVHVDGKLLVRHRHVQAGSMHRTKDGSTRVAIRHRSRLASFFGRAPVLMLHTDHPSQAEAVLAAVGVDVEHQVFRATSLRPQAAWQVLLGVAIYFALANLAWAVVRRLPGVTFHPLVATIPVLFAAALAFGIYALVARTVVTVGSDGIEIRRMLRGRFVPLAEVRDVRVEAKALVIDLASDDTISLAHAAPFLEPVGNFGASDIGMERSLLADRIADAMRLHVRKCRGRGALAALGRADRSLEAWIASLRAIGAGASDYRTPVLSVEELRRAVADTSAASDIRIGAAIALRVADQTCASEQVRVAADATAAPELRALLREAADADDEDLVAALRASLDRS